MPGTLQVDKETGRTFDISSLRTADQAAEDEARNREIFADNQAKGRALSERAFAAHQAKVEQAERERVASEEALAEALKPWLRENQRLAQLLGRATAQYEQAAREADDDILDVPKRVNYIGAFAVRGRVQDLITAHEAAKPV
jgi:hypothetical protein